MADRSQYSDITDESFIVRLSEFHTWIVRDAVGGMTGKVKEVKDAQK